MAGRASSMGFLGAGQMATALARGFIRAGKSLCVVANIAVSYGFCVYTNRVCWEGEHHCICNQCEIYVTKKDPGMDIHVLCKNNHLFVKVGMFVYTFILANH